MTLTERHHLDDVLSDLVAHHVLTDDQAHAVVEAWGPEAETLAPAPPPVAPAMPAPAAPSPVRARLVEAATYLGGVLVAGAVVAFVAQNWEAYSLATRVLMLVGIGVVAAAAGLVVALAVAGGRRTIHDAHAAPRRRVSSVLMVVGIVLAAAAIPVGYEGEAWSVFAAALVALALLVPAHLLASSAVTELAMFGASTLAVGTGLNTVMPERPPWDGGEYPPLWAWDLVLQGAFVVLGLAWASVVSRVLTLPVLAEVVGLLLALEASMSLAVERSSRWYGLALLGLLAVAGVVGFTLRRTWPWLVVSVLAVTIAAFVLASDFANPALAFLVAGLVLLASAGAGAYLGRSRRAPVT